MGIREVLGESNEGIIGGKIGIIRPGLPRRDVVDY